MQIGPYSVESLVEGRFGLDGGSMFGVVPRPLWDRTNPADDRNRIELAARCLVVRGGGRCMVVDTGIGTKFDEKRGDIFKVDHPYGDLLGALEKRGVAAGDVTDVILTHLHFDHCGGTTRREGDRLLLTFPEAVHHVQRRNWNWAHHPTDKDAGSYRAEDFSPLETSAKLHLIDGDLELYPGIHMKVVEGHTPGMQLVRIVGPEATLLFVADLVPTRAHLHWPWIMAFDNQPLVTLEEKRQLLARAAEEGWVIAFEHDPECAAVVLRAEGDAVVVEREVDL